MVSSVLRPSTGAAAHSNATIPNTAYKTPQQQPYDTSNTSSSTSASWGAAVQGLAEDSFQHLYERGVRLPAWCATPTHHATQQAGRRFRLAYGGNFVPHDGNCLFSALAVSMGVATPDTLEKEAYRLRARAVARFRDDYAAGVYDDEIINTTIANMYTPDITCGWGIHFVQQHKLLIHVDDQQRAVTAAQELEGLGMDANNAAATALKDLCQPVCNVESWAAYMLVTGDHHHAQDATHTSTGEVHQSQHRVVTMQYVEDGLLSASVDQGAAFGDDLIIQALADELAREIIIVQAHGAELQEGGALFFLPHCPRQRPEVVQAPLFLLMRGTGWAAAGADHFEPLLCTKMVDDGSDPAFSLCD